METEYEKTLKAENEILRFKLKATEKENQQLRSLINMQAKRLRLTESEPSESYSAPLSACF